MKIIQTASKGSRQAMHKTMADEMLEASHDERGFAITARDAKGRRFHVCLTDAEMLRVLMSVKITTISRRIGEMTDARVIAPMKRSLGGRS